MILRELTAAVKHITASAPAEHVREAQDWAADCEGYPAAVTPPVPYSVGYVVRHYPGGWSAFVTECCADAQS